MWPERPNMKSMLHETLAVGRPALWELNLVFTVFEIEAYIELASGLINIRKNKFYKKKKYTK